MAAHAVQQQDRGRVTCGEQYQLAVSRHLKCVAELSLLVFVSVSLISSRMVKYFNCRDLYHAHLRMWLLCRCLRCCRSGWGISRCEEQLQWLHWLCKCISHTQVTCRCCVHCSLGCTPSSRWQCCAVLTVSCTCVCPAGSGVVPEPRADSRRQLEPHAGPAVVLRAHLPTPRCGSSCHQRWRRMHAYMLPSAWLAAAGHRDCSNRVW